MRHPWKWLRLSALGALAWIIDATPDFREQLHRLDAIAPFAASPGNAELDGIFLTHAHIGHYTGLQHLGREAIGEHEIPVYAMPRLHEFLRTNGPWSLLVSTGHIAPHPLAADEPVRLNERLTVTPILVPHRDEYSETVGYRIAGPGRSVLFVPDIDKWEKWDRNIEEEIERAAVAYLDGTFYTAGELPGRDMSQIPHPLMEESMARFAALAPAVRARVRFLHLNHTNPAMHADSDAAREVMRRGFAVADEGGWWSWASERGAPHWVRLGVRHAARSIVEGKGSGPRDHRTRRLRCVSDRCNFYGFPCRLPRQDRWLPERRVHHPLYRLHSQ